MIPVSEQRALLYLDIDGVVNHGYVPARHGWDTESWGSDTWAPELIKELNELTRADLLDIVWVTSWEDISQLFRARVGLESGETWLLGSGAGRGEDWEKFQSVQEHWAQHQGEYRLFIRVDDELGTEPEAREWAEERGFLTYSPDEGLLSRTDFESLTHAVSGGTFA